jgi:hypothetical protein
MSTRLSWVTLSILVQLGCLPPARGQLTDWRESDILADGVFAIKSIPVTYNNTMFVVSTKDGSAAIMFDKPLATGITYRYRFLPAHGGKEQAGQAEVFEKCKTTSRFLLFSIVEDDGSLTLIKAGPIALGWSRGGPGNGWIYYNPKQVRVESADPKDFTKVDLRGPEKGPRQGLRSR